jgi:hypothetical protein
MFGGKMTIALIMFDIFALVLFGLVCGWLWITRERPQPTVDSSVQLYVMRWQQIADEPIRRYLDSIGWPPDPPFIRRYAAS